METEINLTEPRGGRTAAWGISLISSALAIGTLVARKGDLLRIEGGNVVNLAELSPEASSWFAGFLIASAVCVLPIVRSLQITCGAFAYGMLMFVIIDQGAQFRQFQAMGLIPDSLMEKAEIPWAGWLMGATTLGFLLVILAESILRVVCRRK